RARYDQMFDAYQHGGMDWQQTFGQGAAQTPGGWTVTFGGEGLEDLLGGLGFSDFFKQFFGAEAGAARTGGRAEVDELLRGQGRRNGQTFRLRAQGMHRPGGGRGDQLVRVKVVVPAKPTPKEKQLFEELAKVRKENPRAHLGCK